ncbi:phosphoribosylformylglycinamidine cyclo-ligase [soil metagenome]
MSRRPEGTEPAMSWPERTAGLSYAAAGVDIEAGERAVELIKDSVRRTARPEVIGGIGGFAGLFAPDLSGYTRPVLASATDGVGTKLAIAQAMDVHDTVGIDLVAMVVDDLVVYGAEPLFLQDYIACGKVLPERIAAIVSGIATGCEQAGCALLGGETAEHADLMGAADYDLSATGVGIVDAAEMLGPERVRPGDAVLAMGSSGLHSNGYVLARRVLLDHAGLALDAHVAELDRSLGEELLEPTRLYARTCLALSAEADVHALAHINGGGLAGNMYRVLPRGLDAVVERRTWTPQPVFDLIAGHGGVSPAEMERAFNLGVGMVALVPPDDVDRCLALLTARHVPAWVAGEVVPSDGRASTVRLTGEHPH